MTIHNRRISLLISLSVAAVTFGMITMVAFTYTQVHNELRDQTVSTVQNHLRSQQQLLVQQMRTIAEAKRMMLQVVMATPALSAQEIGTLQRRFNREFQAAQTSVVFLPERDPTVAPTYLVEELQQLYETNRGDRVPHVPIPFPIGSLREAGGWYIGAPFLSSTGLRTIIPIAVTNFRGIHRPNAAIIAVDITHILYSLTTNFFVIIDGRSWPLDIALYDHNGVLLASTLNNLRQQYPPLNPSTNARIAWNTVGPRVPVLEPDSLVVYQDNRITEVVYDSETGLFLAGSIAEPAITRRVALISSQIVVIGVLNVAAILGLGLLLLRSIGHLSAAQEKQMEMYTRSIQAVLGPHFLFNTLDTIVGLAAEERKETLMRSLMALTIQLEGAMRNAANEVTVAQEMEYIASYLEIQGFRFDGRFTMEISVDPDVSYESIPRFCIQPVIENCFTHAIPESTEPVDIALSASAFDTDTIIVVVTDNGPKLSPERRKTIAEALNSRHVDWDAGIGLAAVHARLVGSYGHRYGVRIVEPGDDFLTKYHNTVKDGFTAVVLLPRLKTEADEGVIT